VKRLRAAAFAVLLACSTGGEAPVGGGPDAGSHPYGGSVDASDESPSNAGADATSDSGDESSDDSGDAGELGDSGDSGQVGDSGPPSLCPGSFLFCDGFEQGLTKWNGIQSSAGQVSVDSIHVYRGAKALHANLYAVAEAGAQAWAYASKYGTVPWPSHVFTRLFAYAPSPSQPSIEGLLDLVQNGSPYQGLELRLAPSNAAVAMETFNTGADKTWQSADASAALDQWVCFEVEVDTNAGTSHLYMNDVEITELAQSNLGLPQLGITNVGLTLPAGNVQGASDAWIDEVAVDSARIGCTH
jgi:hypothetical protein